MTEEMNTNIDKAVAVDAEETTERTKSQNRQELKYTDDDVDRIVSKRLARERERAEKLQEQQHQETEFEKRERELSIRERKADARDVLSQQGLPKSLCDLLDYSTEESYKASLKAATEVVEEIKQQFEIQRATGRTPKIYSNEKPSGVRNAFGLK